MAHPEAKSTGVVVKEYWLRRSVLIVGAGPAGLATAACLRSKGVPFVVVERENCVASLWKNKTYDRLHLHLPKQFCQLPMYPFPKSYPTYPTRDQFVDYVDQYANHFDITPVLNTVVKRAEFSPECGLWAVTMQQASSGCVELVQYWAKWLVVASGENGDATMPELPGQDDYAGTIMHGSMYRNGLAYEGKNVLVVGCGNTGMEVALDLANFNAKPFLVVRGPFHVMPRELFGLHISTFTVITVLLQVFPLWLVDKMIVIFSYLTLGNTSKYGIARPKEGPVQHKQKTGKTPVLDVGTVSKIRAGNIKVVPEIEVLTTAGARFVNGVEQEFEVIIMATGYKSTVHQWLKGDSVFGSDGFPKAPFPNGWKGDQNLYMVGLGRMGLLGCGHDATKVADDISKEIETLRMSSHR